MWRTAFLRSLLAATLFCGALVTYKAADAVPAPIETVEQTVCRLVERSAKAKNIPPGFLTRLIWQESAFRADAVSHVGARGIAQFMPATAYERGLADPFDPEQAIPAAADFLSDLHAQFGNIGLAAAAYNAGPSRVSQWMQGRGPLPAETRHYVATITKRPADAWRRKTLAVREEDRASCHAVTAGYRKAYPHLASTWDRRSFWNAPIIADARRALVAFSKLLRERIDAA